jgi:formylmethanofuran dehydrogenase subunit E
VAQTTTVHHDAEGMFQKVQTGTQNVYYCSCRQVFYSDAERRAHDPENDHGYSVTETPIYETQWVETSPAWDEPVTTGYICSVCGTAQ